jgi:hypothetical protein
MVATERWCRVTRRRVQFDRQLLSLHAGRAGDAWSRARRVRSRGRRSRRDGPCLSGLGGRRAFDGVHGLDVDWCAPTDGGVRSWREGDAPVCAAQGPGLCWLASRRCRLVGLPRNWQSCRRSTMPRSTTLVAQEESISTRRGTRDQHD